MLKLNSDVRKSMHVYFGIKTNDNIFFMEKPNLP